MKLLSERAKHRLRIAARLLRGSGTCARIFALSRENFYVEVQALILELTAREQEALRAHTDWVEAYERAEQSLIAQHAHPSRAGRAPRRKAPTPVDQ